MGVVPHAAAHHAVGIGHGEDLDDETVPDARGFGVRGKQPAQRAFRHPGGAALPGVLPGHQPDDRLVLLRRPGVGDGEERHGAAAHRLSHHLFLKDGVAAETFEQRLEVASRVGRLAGNPDLLALGLQLEAQGTVLRVENAGFHEMPLAVVVTVNRAHVAQPGALVAAVVVLARETCELDREVAPRHAVQPEVEPARLAVAVVLVGFSPHPAAEMILRNPLGFGGAAGFERSVNCAG